MALLTDDAQSSRAAKLLRASSATIIVSDFASAEFSSAMARRVRMQDITAMDAQGAFAALDTWRVRSTERAETTTTDIRAADTFVRRLDLTLRTPDALSIAIAARVGAILATFDAKLALAAQILGLNAVPA